jgi:hypothetical protein
MRKLLCLWSLLSCLATAQQPDFERYFLPQTLRIDLYQTGNKTDTYLSVADLCVEPTWAGSLRNLVDNLDLGVHYIKVYDLESQKLIYSRGFCSIFSEWQTTGEAASGVYRTFGLTIRIPRPRNPIKLVIATRNRQNQLVDHFDTVIDPNSRFVRKPPAIQQFKPRKLVYNGDPHTKVDLLLLPDGYTQKELARFRKESRHFIDVLFGTEPFKSLRTHFNVWYLEVPTMVSGTDNPRAGFFASSNFGLTFNTFDLDRYVLPHDNKRLHDIAGNAPFDFVYIIFNSTKYGGGGIYNHIATCYARDTVPANSWWPDYVFVHELGHALGGLADEYYSSSVAYEEFYPRGVEPWEPNITALLDPQNLKWKKLVAPDTPIPTPWRKAEYDSLDYTRAIDRENILRTDKYAGKVGAFQGAGYDSEGLYRPELDCRMFSKSMAPFCRVCQEAIKRVILFYSE